ncbi:MULTISPECIES: DUF488 domain-containing protein [Bacillaceae]|uniref:DUF488 domain-containing protein n=1 Tax=Bacillaceae TaxID=186817 RepID=UPI00053AEA9F|nr:MULTISPECIES: DUF488 family protein [Bacillaceae]
MNQILLQRVYEKCVHPEGLRILIDRLWPRGIKKEDAQLDFWFKEVAPSPDLRKWFGHEPDKFPDFSERYIQELRNDEVKSNKVDEICRLLKDNDIILLFGAKDEVHNHAVVLREEILTRIAK